MPDQSDLELLKSAALQAGKIALRYFGKIELEQWDKSANNPVTEADIAVDRFLQNRLSTARKDYGWLSEESVDNTSRLKAKRTFIIDPIDGTRAFVDGQPHFTICLATVMNGEPHAGVIYNPVKDELFEAYKGGGAKLNGKPITPSSTSAISGCTMIGYPRKFRRLGWPEMDVSIINSMAYRIALVAAGRFDACLAFTPKSDWDLAAACLIAREAGAVITDLSGHEIKFNCSTTTKNGVICAGPTLQALLLDKVRSNADILSKPQINSSLETRMSDREKKSDTPEQLLHLVLGGELVDPLRTEFIDLSKVDFIGAYPNYATAYNAWKDAAQTTVDNAHMRYFILHAHELIDPDNDGIIG